MNPESQELLKQVIFFVTNHWVQGEKTFVRLNEEKVYEIWDVLSDERKKGRLYTLWRTEISIKETFSYFINNEIDVMTMSLDELQQSALIYGDSTENIVTEVFEKQEMKLTEAQEIAMEMIFNNPMALDLAMDIMGRR